MDSEDLFRPCFLYVKLNVSTFLLLVVMILVIVGRNQYEDRVNNMKSFISKM